ncbi:hypothetical protein [Oceanicola sp. 22II-s10i]|nr:hypothetical protein [Oceanicola sp. 22II-s10i]
MNRKHFLIVASLILCLLPVLGTFADTHNEPHRVVQLHSEQLTRHY